ncbi:UNVERIFIED_CONTAM: hypothetical protein RMT77_000240 [Armadillidium vulgare]
MEEDEKQGYLRKHSKERIISTEKKKKLMMKLARIRLNKSHGNSSVYDMSAFYEAKVRKLKSNNRTLARNLSEQKQISQQLYDTIVSLKEELHDSQESLLRLHYQVKGNGDYEHIIQEEVQRRIGALSEPLEATVTHVIRDASNFIENLTKVKQLVTSVISYSNKEKSNFSRRSSHSLLGSRPPLSQNCKSPRKNVVHPMVEGHVLQPATIPIPRMSLQERRRYRLQEQTEIGMEVIGELSSSESESASSDMDDSTSDQIIDEENGDCPLEGVINDDITPADSVKLTSHDEESIVNGGSPIPSSPEDSALDENNTTTVNEDPLPEENQIASGSESPCRAKSETQSSSESLKEETLRASLNAEKADQVCDEDPLEGSSWMHLVKGRCKNSKKRKTKSGKGNIRTSGLHFLPDTSSESEEEHVEIPVGKVKHGIVKGSSRSRPSRNKSSKVSISHLDLLSSNVSKRPKKSDNRSISSIRDSQGTTDVNNKNEESSTAALPSFIMNDSQSDITLLNENSDLKKSPAEKKGENITTIENKLPTSKSPNSELCKESTVNLTCILDSSMEITQCLSKGVLQSLPPLIDQSEESEISVTKTDNIQSNSNTIMSNNLSEKSQSHKASVQDSKKTNKYFKSQENETNEVAPKKQTESCIYDISLMDSSQITSCLTNVGKENVPPNINVSSEDHSMKLKDISIVVKDIMKTSPISDVDQNAFHGFPNSCNKSITPNNTNRRSEKNKCKSKRKGSTSPLKKTSKKPKKMNFSGDCGISILSNPSDSEKEDVWTPTKKTKKRKTKQSKKNATSEKKRNTNETARKSIPLSNIISSTANDNYESVPITIANDFSTKSNNDIDHQIANPLCEIPVDSTTFEAVSSDVFQDVNDIIRKHIKVEVNQIASRDTYEVIELDSDGERDPLAVNDMDLFNARPRRATLKIKSFKEPPLNTKMRNSTGRKTKRAPKKKTVKT